jgi:hypothetical protein
VIVYNNGNITDLYRKGLVHDNNTMDVIDDLDYQYMPYSNRLATVNDFSDRDEGFKDGLNAINNINDYLYDTNGNMISDLNKEISLITYNHLNLCTSALHTSWFMDKILGQL